MREVIFIDADEFKHLHIDTKGAPIIGLTKGECGYHPIFTRCLAEELNNRPTSKAVIESAISASIVGWDVPAAEDARLWFAGKVA